METTIELPARPAPEHLKQFATTLIGLRYVQWGEFKRYADALEAIVATLRAELSRAAEELAAAGNAMERDRTSLAAAVTGITKAIRMRDWLAESRGPYEWDDDRFHSEFSAALDEILQAIEPLRKIAADWTGCPKDSVAVEAARADLQIELSRERERHQGERAEDAWKRGFIAGVTAESFEPHEEADFIMPDGNSAIPAYVPPTPQPPNPHP